MVYPRVYGLPNGLGFSIQGLGFSVLLTALLYPNLFKKLHIQLPGLDLFSQVRGHDIIFGK